MQRFKFLLNPLLLTGLATPVFANTYTIGFDNDDNTGIRMPASLFPSGEFLDANGELQSVERSSYIEHGFEHNAIVFNNQADGSHLHATANIDMDAGTSSAASTLSADAGGGFFKQTSGEQFSLESWDFIELSTVVEDELFNLNPDRFNPAPESHLVVQGSLSGAEQFTLDFHDDITLLDTFDFLAATNGASANVDLVEYWFSGTGRGVIPLNEHVSVEVAIDNVVVSNVPLPAAFYLYFSGFIGLTRVLNKRSKNT
ncbi:MAG: hypothetical protein V3V18_05755 [Methylococcales bacterium]